MSSVGRVARHSLATAMSNRLTVVDATSATIRREVGPFSGYLCPFAINRKDTLVFANIDGLLGFEVGDLRTGLVLDRVQLDDYGPDQLKQYECPSHGIAFTPDERELWLADGVGNRLRIFDATTYPPQDKSSIDLTRQPRSITFSHDGRFAYASTGDVIDVATRRIVAVLKDEEGRVVQSERMIEVNVP
jgi:DNA-binding beta-propeller fold protein YncE